MKPLTEDQRKAARAKAAIARAERAEVKEQLRAGTLSVARIVNDDAERESIGRLKVMDLLRCLPGIGEKRALSIMEEIKIAPTRRVRGLGVNQKRALVDYVDRHSSPKRKE